MRWHLIIEEYSPELIYLKGEHNIVADALSRLELISPENQQQIQEHSHDMHYLADHFGLKDDDLPVNAYPLQFKIIAKYQQKQPDLVSKVQKHEGFQIKSFCGGGKKRDLICHNEKIVIPTAIQRRVVEWYHEIMSSWRNQNRANSETTSMVAKFKKRCT
jgi:hypothetical protein